MSQPFKSNRQAAWLKHNLPAVYYSRKKKAQAIDPDRIYKQANKLAKGKKRRKK